MQALITSDSPASAAASTFARILVPIDFSPASKRALATALALAKGMGSEVHLFHLAEETENDHFLAGIGADAVAPKDLAAATRERLARFVDNVFPGRANEVVFHARLGVDVVHGIERIAREVGATLVLLGGRPRQAIFRTNIEKIARDLDGAVMLVWTPDEPSPS